MDRAWSCSSVEFTPANGLAKLLASGCRITCCPIPRWRHCWPSFALWLFRCSMWMALSLLTPLIVAGARIDPYEMTRNVSGWISIESKFTLTSLELECNAVKLLNLEFCVLCTYSHFPKVFAMDSFLVPYLVPI